jgi:pyruvate,orthophosphate dikinase
VKFFTLSNLRSECGSATPVPGRLAAACEVREIVRYVWSFTNRDPAAIPHLGVRGTMMRTLAERGIPVPPGFTISDVACRRFLEAGEFPEGMWEEVVAAVDAVREANGQDRPMLLAVRSSPPVTMPGILGRCLYVGHDADIDRVVTEWASERFARHIRIEHLCEIAAQRRIPSHRIDAAAGDSDAGALAALIVEESQRTLSQDPLVQLREAIEGVFASWDDGPARRHRRHLDLSDDLGTSVIVHAMVFGSADDASGAGVAFSRNPETGEPGMTGVWSARSHRPASVDHYPGLDDLAAAHPQVHEHIGRILADLEDASHDMMRIDFVCERGQLWLLDARPGERTARAAVQIAVDLAVAGVLTREEAVLAIDPAGLEQMLHDRLREDVAAPALLVGGAASPGAAAGEIALDGDTALAAVAAGRAVILVRRETTPEDLASVVAADGVLTSHGGPTSHAAVAARGTGTPAVTGAGDVVCDPVQGVVHIAGTTLRNGDTITIDGSTGAVYRGVLPIEPATPSAALDLLLTWANEFRRMEVWANADTPDAAAHARSVGAEGVGLARTEYMFSGSRLEVVRRIILTEDARERSTALEELEKLQIGDFERLLESMDGLPVVVRLLDPPLHEFLPDRREVDAAIRRAREAGEDDTEPTELLAAIDQWEESNPMLGLRGVRLAVVIPEIYRIQVLAALEAVRRRLDTGGDPRLELMIPLVGTAEEVHLIRDMIDEEVHYAGRQLDVTVGTMIELPRAALVAADFALQSDFFSFGTNDLTQTTLGISRDDAEDAFLRTYLEKGILRRDPFTTIDQAGVGRLIESAIDAGRRANPGLLIGVCGEHGGDPESIEFFEAAGVDYVSCSPPRIPVALLAASQAALKRRHHTAGT